MSETPQVLIGVGGTLTTLAAMDLKLDVYDAKRLKPRRDLRIPVSAHRETAGHDAGRTAPCTRPSAKAQ